MDGELFTVKNLNTAKVFLNDKEKDDKYGVSDIWKEDNQEVVIKILLHCYWLMYLGSDRLKMQTVPDGYYVDNAQKDFFDDIKCVWAIGQTFTRDPLGSMLKIVNMVIYLKDLQEKVTTENAKREIINYWSKQQEDDRNSNVANVLLYFCDPENFLPIPSYQNKKKISDNLGWLIASEQEPKGLPAMSDLDKNLYKIREALKNYVTLNNDYQYSSEVILDEKNPFWHQNIKPFWEDTPSNLKGDLSLEELLEYKKALVLYGPPGTSKSFSAREIAKHIIVKALRNAGKIKEETFSKFSGTCNEHIHSLQFHPNYTYDDFIIGKTIEKNSVAIKKGWLLELIDNIQNDELPHIIILDEINRVDISRVFGELLTAMEPAYRGDGKGVDLPVNQSNGKKIKLIVPENMYFIGTMNQIDFSLEQVDFALRRRFIWQLSTYSENTLEHMIESKNDGSIPPDRIDEYSSQCTKLNNVIKDNENLGESYWIGHTYFAEIVNIYKQIKENGKDDWDAAKNVLWQISIRPTLEAYCGTMDAKAREDFIAKCEEKFMPKDNKSKSQKKNDSSTDLENPK